MGFVRKITGVQAQIDSTNANAAAQAEATKSAADSQQAALMQSAQASATQQAQLSARSAAEAKASTAVSAPLGKADVQLDTNPTESVSASRNRKRASFGRNYSTGVSI